MAKCRNLFLSLQNISTDRALRAFGKTGFSAGCGFARNCLLGMRNLCDYLSLTAEFFLTLGAIDDFVVGAFFGAGCSNFVFSYRLPSGMLMFWFFDFTGGELKDDVRVG